MLVKTAKLSTLGLLLFLLITACQNKKTKLQTKNNINTGQLTDSSVVPEMDNRESNDIGRYIAGLEGTEGNTIQQELYTESWKNYAIEQNKKWTRLNNEHFKNMHDFAQTELKPFSNENDTLFYPFSGPDFINATTFFPDVKTYIMMALEPPGNLPNVNQFDRDSIGSYLNSINQSLYAILNFSFFRTLSMEDDFDSEHLNGAVQLISVFIQRSGHSTLSIEQISIDNTGAILAASPNSTSGGTQGIHVTCINNTTKKIKNIYYFSCDISDIGLNKNKGLLHYLSKLNHVNTYIKSASYLLHKPYFGSVRNIILSKSNLILQDDSGIPIKFFNADQWQHQFYGTYTQPIKLFRNSFQQDLRLAYDSTEKNLIKPLNFGIGYNYKLNESNLMLFKHKK